MAGKQTPEPRSEWQTPEPPLFLQECVDIGADGGRGNLLGIQPVMTVDDYHRLDRFKQKLGGYLEAAAQREWITEKTVVVFPEYIGTWLVALEAPQRVLRARSLTGAMLRLIMRRPAGFTRQLFRAHSRDRIKDALFRMHADRIADAYQQAFSRLASRFGVTVVAGSVLMPGPRVEQGVLRPGDGPLYNVGAVFHPDGRLDERLIKKVHPIPLEEPYTCAADPAELPHFDTPAGRMGVLICADSWYPDTYAALRPQGVQFVVVPSYLVPAGIWESPWRGYGRDRTPDDVDLRDLKTITEKQAWLKYALAGRVRLAGCHAGVNVFLRGTLWDLGSDGSSVAVWDGGHYVSRATDAAALLNLWL